MNFAHLGPTPPTHAPDTAPVRLLSWAVLHDLTGLNEAVVSFNVVATGVVAGFPVPIVPIVLLVMVCPRRLKVMRVKWIGAAGDSGTIEPEQLTGNLHDLAISKVRSMFCERAAQRG